MWQTTQLAPTNINLIILHTIPNVINLVPTTHHHIQQNSASSNQLGPYLDDGTSSNISLPDNLDIDYTQEEPNFTKEFKNLFI